MQSALRTVDKRCAMMTVVLSADFSPAMRLSSDLCTIFSLSLSRAEVASSRRRILWSLITALAIAMRCFCPPETFLPRVPTL
mmetsp:Transcript_14324/g.33369  ORF Transcript_14324/g.33369 Transcript_14324/m.33369 type:complete len:82 (-) Transcript_14324:1113-1358(-)